MSDFILVLIVIFLVFGIFRRYIFFFLMTAISRSLFKEMNRMQQRQQEMFRGQNRNSGGNVKPENERKTKNKGQEGDYVDFEEIKD